MIDLPTRWRSKAENLRRYAPAAAEAFDEAAAELEAVLKEEGAEKLTPAQAGRESGYTAVHIRRLIADGTLPNVGTEEAPLVLRRDLPRKPGHGIVAPEEPRPVHSRSQVVRAVVDED